MTSSSSIPEGAARPQLKSVLLVGVLFIILGSLDIWRGLAPMFTSVPRWHMALDDAEVLAIGIAAIVGGIYVIRGANWARWLLAVWMVLHVAISIGQPTAFVAHLAIFGCIAYLLFRPRASEFFTRTETG